VLSIGGDGTMNRCVNIWSSFRGFNMAGSVVFRSMRVP
jgi:hypothetical protein